VQILKVNPSAAAGHLNAHTRGYLYFATMLMQSADKFMDI
jgi:hypothetical protein